VTGGCGSSAGLSPLADASGGFVRLKREKNWFHLLLKGQSHEKVGEIRA
jgi:hypothetical protein